MNLKIKDPYCSTTALFTLANKAQQRFLTSFFYEFSFLTGGMYIL